ncbi:uncharacterized protein KY384_004409 [Bacidia gigantensis]|uniref:uncharacterized protein n=1 Tax=Bacidia gigantensis TaxID=2732470 RepID=UPI001D053875|nr:uncharacterized protein KY384_004409 [Bacidia gigantensis]KAG8531052.1 hypothetical protein KY384_004409 [Bacidia gigantensis]
MQQTYLSTLDYHPESRKVQGGTLQYKPATESGSHGKRERTSRSGNDRYRSQHGVIRRDRPLERHKPWKARNPEPSVTDRIPREQWQIQKKALSQRFPQGWSPRKRLSPDALEGIRSLHTKDPILYDTPALANQFKVSPEAVRRILKSNWRPSDEEDDDRKKRWENRGQRIWDQMSDIGVKPPKKWRNGRTKELLPLNEVPGGLPQNPHTQEAFIPMSDRIF